VAATDEYFQNEDSIANWVDERCEVGKGLMDPSSKLFASWKDYAVKAGLVVGDTRKFKEEMNRHGYTEKRTSVGVIYQGLQIRQDDPGGDPDHLEPF
jgi:putative DNA primase/helicase